MATRCTVCGAEIPDEVSTCPHCEATAVGERFPLAFALLIIAGVTAAALYFWHA